MGILAVLTTLSQILQRITINNFKAGEFDVYLDWSIPNELGIYVDRPLSDMQTEQFASAIINLETGEVN